MALFGNGSGSGFLNDLKATLGFAPREEYDDEYDMYSDNFDDYSTYDEGPRYDDRMRFRASNAYAESAEYIAGGSYGEVIERDPADREYYDRGYRPYGDLALSSMSDVRRRASYAEQERRTYSNRQSYRSSDYLSSGAVERESALEAGRMPHRPRYADRGGLDRKLCVLVPTAYEDAEKVARALQAKDAVVLDFGRVRADLVKRILDFSFGAASVAGARVECIADKVFSITMDGPITEGERVRLRSQGVRL